MRPFQVRMLVDAAELVKDFQVGSDSFEGDSEDDQYDS
jgi:hypothetical protein